MRSWVRMRSESTRAFGQPRDTKPTLGLAGAIVVDMSNLGVGGSSLAETGRLNAPLIKKCAILSRVDAVDQLYTGKCDECCAMLRAFAYRLFLQSIKRL